MFVAEVFQADRTRGSIYQGCMETIPPVLEKAGWNITYQHTAQEASSFLAFLRWCDLGSVRLGL